MNARIQNFIASHNQARFSPAEQFGEQLAKVRINFVKGGLQQIAGFTIDFMDRVFERIDGSLEV